jgi:hypothetical protein
MQFSLARPIAGIEKPFQIAAMQPLRARPFGEEVYLGMRVIHVPMARFDGVRGDEETGTVAALLPVDGANVATRFHPPAEVPEEAAGQRQERRFRSGVKPSRFRTNVERDERALG